MPGSHILWVDELHKTDCEKAAEILRDESLEFVSMRVEDYRPYDLLEVPPVLITPHGEFCGIEQIKSYAKIPVSIRDSNT